MALKDTIKAAMTTSLQNFATKAYQVFAEKDEIHSYSLTAKAEANSGMVSSYEFKVDDSVVTTIDIPKDFLVKNATLETANADNAETIGANVGDKYIDFVINAKDGSETASHLYLPVQDLVDTYTAGNGIDVTSNTISVKIDTTNANGLEVTAGGLKLGTASASTTGALSDTDWTAFNAKQEQVIVGTATGDGNVITAISLNADKKTLDIEKNVTAVTADDFEALTAAEISTLFAAAKTAAAGE